MQSLFVPTEPALFSGDLHNSITWGYDLPGAPDSEPLRNSIYFEETDTRSLRTILRSQTEEKLFFAEQLFRNYAGLSDDARHFAFENLFTRLLPEAAPGWPNVYQWDDGVLSLAGVLPDGSVPPQGSTAALKNYSRNMSADGSRLLFSAAPEPEAQPQLYQRIEGNRTVWISEPEGSDKSQPVNVFLQAATPDGRNVFFVTDSPLLDADQSPGPDLYRWSDGPDPEHESTNLTLITHDGSVPSNFFGGSVDGVSDDGQIVYIQTISSKLEVWDHGTMHIIAQPVDRPVNLEDQFTVNASIPGRGRATANGEFFAFLPQTSGDAELTESELYLYSLADEELVCASCLSGGDSPPAKVEPLGPNVTSSPAEYKLRFVRPRFLAEDGRVFFSTTASLVPEDTNGTWDAYQFDPGSGAPSLLSSGRGENPTAFIDASASGNDVFIATRQHLVGADTDELVDEYDVRTGGGFPEPEPAAAPCTGEGCRGAASGAPAGAAVSSTAPSRGNVKAHRCRKAKRGENGGGNARCVRRHRHPHSRTHGDRGRRK